MKIKEKNAIWAKNANKAFKDNVRKNKVLDKKQGSKKLVNYVG